MTAGVGLTVLGLLILGGAEMGNSFMLGTILTAAGMALLYKKEELN